MTKKEAASLLRTSDKLSHSIRMLHIHGFLTDREFQAKFGRLAKWARQRGVAFDKDGAYLVPTTCLGKPKGVPK